MARRKNTDKTSKPDIDDQGDTGSVAEPEQSQQSDADDMETATNAVEAVDRYAPAETTSDQSDAALTDEALVQQEPEPEDQPDMPGQTEAGVDATPDDHISEDEAERLILEAETVEPHHETVEPLVVPEHSPGTPNTPPVAPQVIRETTIERKGGFVPMLLGGLVAAGLGYGAAAYVSQDVWPFVAASDDSFEADTRAALAGQDSALSDLGSRIASLETAEPPSVDLTPIQDQLSALEATTSDLVARLEDMAARIDTLERQPFEQAVSPEAIAAYERALGDLQAEVDAQRAEVAQMAQEAIAAEENAEEKARLAAARAALAEITAALDTGAAYSGAISVLAANGETVPDALSAHAETGIPTQTALAGSFPDAARAALSAARSAETEAAQGAGRIATFLANQVGARSVAPREGDAPDAILSRAEAAVRSGDLQSALAELSGLPDVAQPALADWKTRAETRLEAKTAADGLVQRLLQE